MPDLIEIRGLRALGIIGVLPGGAGAATALRGRLRPRGRPGEGRRQPTISPTPSTTARLAVLAEQVVATEPHLLLERVAQRIADELLAARRARRRHARHDPQAAAAAPGRRGHARPSRIRRHAVTRAFARPRLQPRATGCATCRTRSPCLPDLVGRARPSTRPTRSAARTTRAPYLNMVVQLETERSTRTSCSSSATASRRRPAASGSSAGDRGRSTSTCSGWTASTVDEPDLIVPHPRMRERPFVLAPLSRPGARPGARGWERRFDHLGVSRLGELDELSPLAEA